MTVWWHRTKMKSQRYQMAWILGGERVAHHVIDAVQRAKHSKTVNLLTHSFSGFEF